MDAITETDNLLIRRLTTEDADALVPILGDPEVMEFSTTGPLSLEEIFEWLEKRFKQYEHPGFSFWAVVLKSTDKVIGICGILPLDIDGRIEIEIGYRFNKAYWGQGYAREATKTCCSICI